MDGVTSTWQLVKIYVPQKWCAHCWGQFCINQYLYQQPTLLALEKSKDRACALYACLSLTIINLALKIHIFLLECAFFWSLHFTLNVCLPLTCPLLLFHCMVHCYYSCISHVLDENIALKVKKGSLSCFIRISSACPINWLNGTFVLQLTLLFLLQRTFIPLKSIFLSELDSAGFSFKTAVRHLDMQNAILLSASWELFPANVLDQLPCPRASAVSWPSFVSLLPCSLFSSVFHHLIKYNCLLLWVIFRILHFEASAKKRLQDIYKRNVSDL